MKKKKKMLGFWKKKKKKMLEFGNYLSCRCFKGVDDVRPEKFQFLEKGQNRNFDYKIVILVKNSKFIL